MFFLSKKIKPSSTACEDFYLYKLMIKRALRLNHIFKKSEYTSLVSRQTEAFFEYNDINHKNTKKGPLGCNNG